ncbi:MAG: ABC transporter substrate-binding protein [Alphaproteobacteria bacterium]|nr:ABC transporter substrate-binding protein [Alphaproteobacteria bacterium]
MTSPAPRTFASIAVGALGLAALLGASPAFAQGKTIKIAALMPISGPASYFGVQDKQGMELALEELNKAGVNGTKLEIRYEDSACSPLAATQTVKRVLDEYKPQIVLGEECSDASLAIMPVLEEAEMPLLNAGSATVKLTQSGYKYVFRIFPNAQQQGDDMARHAYNDLGARTAVTLAEKTNAGIDSSDYFAAAFTKLGGKVLEKVDFGRDVNDFTAIATRIAGLGKIDVLPTAALEGQSVKLTQALAQAQVTKGGGGQAIQMGSIWLPVGFDQKAGPSSTGYIRIVQFDPNEQRPRVQQFVTAFKAKYGADVIPSHINAHAYDQIQLVAEAVKRGATDPKSFRTQLAGMKGVECVTGTIDFDATGQNSNLSVIHYVETTPTQTLVSRAWK